MAKLSVKEMKVFLPAKEYALSRAFYCDLGFDLTWEAPEKTMARFVLGSQAFMLHDYYEKNVAEAMYMHLLVPDVEQWWAHVMEEKLAERYPIQTEPPEDRPWGIRDFVLVDPSGVLWRIGHQIDKEAGEQEQTRRRSEVGSDKARALQVIRPLRQNGQ